MGSLESEEVHVHWLTTIETTIIKYFEENPCKYLSIVSDLNQHVMT